MFLHPDVFPALTAFDKCLNIFMLAPSKIVIVDSGDVRLAASRAPKAGYEIPASVAGFPLDQSHVPQIPTPKALANATDAKMAPLMAKNPQTIA